MGRFISQPHRLFAGLLTLNMLVFGGGALHGQPVPSPNLPVFTSPIDVTGLKIVLRATAPDRETGAPVVVPLPPGLAGPKFSRLLATPLSDQLDRYWSVDKDPRTGLTPREAACEGSQGIKAQVGVEVAKLGNQAHDVSCSLSSTGQLLAKQIGSTIILAYQLLNNTVGFQSTSPLTCNPNNGSIFCPNDPRFTVKFAIQLVTTLRVGGICEMAADGGTVFIQSPSFQSNNAAAEIARFFAGQRFVAAEVGISNTVRQQTLPLDDILQETRASDLCTRRLPGAGHILFAFQDFQPEIDVHQGIVFHATHGGILPPVVSIPQPTMNGGLPPLSVPSFFRPTISTAQPLVRAGDAVALRGQHFPPFIDLATRLPIGLEHDSRDTSQLLGQPLGGPCFGGGGTDLEFGPVGGALLIQRLAASLEGACSNGTNQSNLSPSTAYRARARDCDPFTCSPWSAVALSTTSRIIPGLDEVSTELDLQVPLGVAIIDIDGRFDLPVTIPAGTVAGPHVIRAATRDAGAVAETSIQVAPAGGSQGSIMIVGVLNGETGCPNHPLTSTVVDDNFLLFGSGFAAGEVVINLDSVVGQRLGVAAVRGDGTICERISGPSADKAGSHALVAVQQGAEVARTDITFVLPTIIR